MKFIKNHTLEASGESTSPYRIAKMKTLHFVALLLVFNALACKDGSKSAASEDKAVNPVQTTPSSSEPTGKAYLTYEMPAGATSIYPVGLSGGLFVFGVQLAKSEDANMFTPPPVELFLVNLDDDKWKPRSLGINNARRAILAGRYLLGIDDNNKAWTFELPKGPVITSDITWSVLDFNSSIQDTERVLVLKNGKFLSMSKEDGEVTVVPKPTNPGYEDASVLAKALDRDQVLLQVVVSGFNSEGALTTNLPILQWLDLSTGKYSEQEPFHYVVSVTESGILIENELFRGGKKVPGGQEVAKAHSDSECRLHERNSSKYPGGHFIACNVSQASEPESLAEPVHAEAQIVQPTAITNGGAKDREHWVLWKESWGKDGENQGFFAAPKR